MASTSPVPYEQEQSKRPDYKPTIWEKWTLPCLVSRWSFWKHWQLQILTLPPKNNVEVRLDHFWSLLNIFDKGGAIAVPYPRDRRSVSKKVQNSQHFLTTIEGLEQVKLMVMLAVMLVKTLSESEKPHGMKPFLTSPKRKDSEQGKETFQEF